MYRAPYTVIPPRGILVCVYYLNRAPTHHSILSPSPSLSISPQPPNDHPSPPPPPSPFRSPSPNPAAPSPRAQQPAPSLPCIATSPDVHVRCCDFLIQRPDVRELGVEVPFQFLCTKSRFADLGVKGEVGIVREGGAIWKGEVEVEVGLSLVGGV